MKLKMSWKQLGPAVWENEKGDRIHCNGEMLRLNSQRSQVVYAFFPPFIKCLKIMGDNKKRAIMLYVEDLRNICKSPTN